MAQWTFEDVPVAFVQQDPTQRDQFNNDEVGLAEALVREVIQNSTDAPAEEGGAVKVSFAVHALSDAEASQLGKIFDSLRQHLSASGFSDAPIGGAARVLVIEDFGTRGLTGKTDALDNENFRNFWRLHGRSGKGGTSGGRWGLGKLVFSSSSDVRAFFGLTVRAGDTGPLLMGQAVLRNHEIDGHRHPAHGFWFEARGNEGIQLPVTDQNTILEFAKLTGVSRKMQPGLSIVVPYLNSAISEAALIEAVLRNYYFSILAGRLVVEVGSILIDQKSFHVVAANHAKTGFPLDFVEAVGARLKAEPTIVCATGLSAKGISDKSFDPAQLESMKNDFRDGKLLHVRIPVTPRRISGDEVPSRIDLFLKRLPEDAKPFGLFARGSITVPGETRYFSGIQAYGAMVAQHKGITEFLGDAENPAHTNWIASAEKLAERWKSPGQLVKGIRYALRELYTIVADQVAREDRNALIDLFSLVDPARSASGLKKRTPKPVIITAPKEKAISIRPRKGGFEILAGPAASKWTFPKRIKVRVAYDTMAGNPFTAHSKYDFDLTGNDIKLETKEASIESRTSSTFVISASGSDFSIGASGFDPNRDLVVDARTP